MSTLATDDDRFYSVVAAATTSRTRTTSFVATFSGVPSDVTGLAVTYKAKSSLSCNQRISLDRAGSWDLLNSTSVGATEVLVTTSPTAPASDYVASTGRVRVNVQCSAAGDGLTTSGDLLTLRYDRPAT